LRQQYSSLTYIYIYALHLPAASPIPQCLSQIYHHHEKGKNHYKQRILVVDNWTK